jgi:Holliday junction resolvasome RuvABC DNA-binding subunit
MKADLLSALINLGYHRPLAEKAVESTIRDGLADFEALLKRSLRELAK